MNKEQLAAAEEAIRFMKEHLDEDITSDQLAAHVGYSPFHFARIFKNATGISPRHYLSALRIETGKKALLKEPSLLMKVLLSIGFRSAGSFNTRFKQNVGISPRKFRAVSLPLSRYVRRFEEQELEETEADALLASAQRICCHIEAPESFRGIIFVGLFPHPIPDQRPVAGTALNRKNRTCTFTKVPPGTYHALAAGIPWSINPKDYFVLTHALRGKFPSAIEVTETSEIEIPILIREPLAVDPPIVINLPLLLFEQKEKNKAK
ncbi:helix-turn-helix domain-containing protein [Paenibacillus sp. HJL G12]|uniref:Helix-turn-helix domain-containing protein n=1 Tax=Paenibacillus dendrobii TaxID=2691084 RepID=A0A7X3IG98_9BACL|nr:AraC family transcriptional regulator [Paenibacillus dendrobii]MWV42988.1 helix-turn-helix domain-containing protein [Paenibacillus dendrobii]